MSGPNGKKLETGAGAANIVSDDLINNPDNNDVQVQTADVLVNTPDHSSADDRKEIQDEISVSHVSVEDLKYKKLDVEKFNLADSEARANIDRWKLSIDQEKANVKADSWDYQTIDGLDDIMSSIQRLGIDINDPFYKNCFGILRDAIKKDKNSFLNDPNLKNSFKNPVQNLELIKDLKSNNFNGELYAGAISHIMYIQSIALSNSDSRLKIGEKKGVDGYVDTAGNFIGDIGDDFKRAIKEKNWPAVAAYSAGGLMTLGLAGKLWDKLTGDGAGKSNKFVLLAILGVGMVAGGTKYGNDLLRLKDENLDVDGSSLDSMYGILNESPNPNIQKLKDRIDFQTFSKVEDVYVTDLYNLSEKSNSYGVNFISPHEFPNIFPEFNDVPPFDFSKGNKGLDKYADASTVMSSKRARFIEKGRELYDIVYAMKYSYENTLQKNDPTYNGLSFEQAINRPELNLGTVHNMFDAIRDNRDIELLRRKNDMEEITKNIETIFAERTDTNSKFDVKIDKFVFENHYFGHMNGYPVYVVFDRNKNSYRIFPANKVAAGSADFGNDFLAEFDLDKPDDNKQSADKAFENLNKVAYATFNEYFKNDKTYLEKISGKTDIEKKDVKFYYQGSGKWFFAYTIEGEESLHTITFADDGKIKVSDPDKTIKAAYLNEKSNSNKEKVKIQEDIILDEYNNKLLSINNNLQSSKYSFLTKNKDKIFIPPDTKEIIDNFLGNSNFTELPESKLRDDVDLLFLDSFNNHFKEVNNNISDEYINDKDFLDAKTNLNDKDYNSFIGDYPLKNTFNGRFSESLFLQANLEEYKQIILESKQSLFKEEYNEFIFNNFKNIFPSSNLEFNVKNKKDSLNRLYTQAAAILLKTLDSVDKNINGWI